MKSVIGKIAVGSGQWTKRMERAGPVFNEATGETLHHGTLNIKLAEEIAIEEHFRVLGEKTGDQHENYLLEICRVDGIWAYRVRPLGHDGVSGGWGDSVLEILCKDGLREKLGKGTGDEVTVEFFRSD